MTDVSVKIGGVSYLDIQSLNVTYSIEQFARTFRLAFTDKWLTSAIGSIPFEEGDEVEIVVDGETLVDGFIDDVPIRYSANDHGIEVSGRSWTGHLIDCSAIHKSGAWKDVTLKQIATDICKPFGITVKVDPLTVLPLDKAETEKFKKYAIEDEETAYDCIARAAKQRGVMMTSDNARNLVFTKASKVSSGASLVKGLAGGIITGRRFGRFRERFRDYLVKSQNAGTDDFFGEDAASKNFFKTDDPGVTAYRPLIIVSETQGVKGELELRANWERNVRAGKSRRVIYQVRGAHKLPGPMGQPGEAGPVWAINETVLVDDSFLDVTDNLLVIRVGLSYSQSGTVTELELGRPEAFDPLVKPSKRTRRSKGWTKDFPG